LTIENENGIKTMRISEWLHEDPVAFDKIRREHNIKVNHEIFCILVSKLKANHSKYFRDALGLNARIKFKGYDGQVKAIVPYTDNPVEFYKWWCLNQDLINMTFAEKIKLFDKVLMEDQNALKREHKHQINN
jgi:ATP-dependent DNA helicase RecQ